MTGQVSIVTVRFWAGARQAAGTAEQQVEAATLADALDAVRAGRDSGFAQVLSVCSLVVGDQPVGKRDPASVELGDGVVVEVLPPFAGGAHAGTARAAPASSAHGWRTPALAFVVGAALAATAPVADGPVWLLTVLLQVALVAGWHRAMAATAPVGGMVAGAVVAVVADITVWVVDGATAAPLAAVVGATFLLAAVQQLARRDERNRVTESMAATTALGAWVAAAAMWPLLLRLPHGQGVVSVASAAVAVASLARLVPSKPVAAVAGPVAGLVTGVAVSLVVSGVPVAEGALLGLVVALPALAADLLDRQDPRLAARAWYAAAAWPFALAAPLAYLVARIAGG